MSDGVIGVGIIGLGTVGRGVYNILKNNSSEIKKKAGAPIEIKKVLVRDTGKDRGLDVSPGLLTDNAADIINNPEIDLVVEVMGGVNPALKYALAALKQGKSLITANKDMIALHGKELFAAAEANKADLLFEASVAGGIPIISPMKQSLTANRVEQIMGIINGTTNYMLTRMTKEGIDFAEVLKEAQDLGYAEADPAADIEGYDAARKLAILSSIGFNSRVPLEQVYVEGITRITADDIAYANELNYVIKLLGIAKDTPQGIEVRVHPTMLPKNHPLASVNDVYNAIFIHGDAVGDVMFYGRGAGELPTASAVTADIITASRNIQHNVQGIIGCTCYYDKPVKPMGDTLSKYYVRLKAVDKLGVLAEISLIFGGNAVSLASVIQKQTDGEIAQIVLVTHEVLEKNMQNALAKIKELPNIIAVSSMIRAEGPD